MTLGFSTKIKGKPTRFPEKIWQSLMQDVGLTDEVYYKWHGEEGVLNYNMGNNYDDSLFNIDPKKHTIRKDEKDRWRVGVDIHFVIGNRTKHRFQFAPTCKVISVQKLEIKHNVGHVEILIDEETYFEIYHHGLDDIYEWTTGLETFVKNDGFETIYEFLEWFNEDFKGKIIHWTNLTYKL